MPTVYITQIPTRRDRTTGEFVPTVDVNPAKEHGEIEVLVSSEASFHATAELVRKLTEKLKNYNYDDGDTIISMGDPSVMAAAFAILGKTRSKFTILKWDRLVHRYLPTKIILR